MNIGTAIAGSPPLPVMDASTTYSITIDVPGLGIAASLSAPMPSGTTLKITLAVPGGATSLGAMTLTGSPQTLAKDLPVGTFSNLGITYEFSADETAGVVPLTSRSVTLTITSVP